MHGKKVCHMHGGKTPTGYGLPQTTHGRYSSVLPVRLAQRYEEARTSQDLLSVREDLAVCESRLADLFGRLDTGESGQVWHAMCRALELFRAALAMKDATTMNDQLQTMCTLAARGRDDHSTWREIMAVWDSRCRLTLTEQKVLVTSQQMVSTEKLMIMLGVIANVIKQTV
jgi:hypothetical protein